MFVIELPFPERKLSPNFRGHWAVILKAKRAAKNAAILATNEARSQLTESELALLADPNALIPYALDITMPDRRNRDEDNVIASLKATYDGIASALDFDDSRLRLTWVSRSKPSKPGKVTISLFKPIPSEDEI